MTCLWQVVVEPIKNQFECGNQCGRNFNGGNHQNCSARGRGRTDRGRRNREADDSLRTSGETTFLLSITVKVSFKQFSFSNIIQNILKLCTIALTSLLYFLYFTVRFNNSINNVATQKIFHYISNKDKELYEKHSRDTLRGRLTIFLNGDCIHKMIIRGKLDKLYSEEVLGNLKCLKCLIIGQRVH